jgi:hypothetical protein
MKYGALILLAASAFALHGCNQQPSKSAEKAPKATKAKEAPAEGTPVEVVEQPGTPMAERIAVISLLNKRNGQTRDFELKPGESVRLGKVALFVRACERTAPWETYPDQGAFVRVAVRERPPKTNDREQWRWVFSGWLFKENPAANVMEHPVYDVWVKACKMSFPGEEPSPEDKPKADTGEDNNASSAPQSEPRRARPAPEAEPGAEEEEVNEAEGEATIET